MLPDKEKGTPVRIILPNVSLLVRELNGGIGWALQYTHGPKVLVDLNECRNRGCIEGRYRIWGVLIRADPTADPSILAFEIVSHFNHG
jgi:hypothetical protein